LLQLRRIPAFYLHELLIFYSRTHVDSGPSILLNLFFNPSRVTAAASSNSSYDPADQLFKFLLASELAQLSSRLLIRVFR
jgi:hypothetical protein